MSDETNLEEAASFDFSSWLEKEGIANGADKIPEDSPEEIKRLLLRDMMVVPEPKEMSANGDLEMKISSGIKIKDFATLIAEFAEIKN